MQSHSLVALVTLAALLVYFGFAVGVGRARAKSGIEAPVMTGDAALERALRVHFNTLEWLPLFLASLWLFALYWNDRVAAALGVIWIVGRLLYARGYMANPAKRRLGFTIQGLATAVLLFGALGRILYVLAVVGA